jgi:hypothetical protein
MVFGVYFRLLLGNPDLIDKVEVDLLSFSDIRSGPSSVLRQANLPGCRAACLDRSAWFWPGLQVDGRTGSLAAIE